MSHAANDINRGLVLVLHGYRTLFPVTAVHMFWSQLHWTLSTFLPYCEHPNVTMHYLTVVFCPLHYNFVSKVTMLSFLPFSSLNNWTLDING